MARQPRQLAGIGASDLPNQAAVDAYKGPPREIVVGTETIHIQDGQTPGGIPLARRSDVALKVDNTLPLAGDLLSRPTEGKIRERRTLLDFIPWQRHASIRDGTISETVDLKDSMALAAAFAKQPFRELVIPGGLYPYSVSPNWAGNHVRIVVEGEVRFRYTGTGDAFTCDAGPVTRDAQGNVVAPGFYGMHIGSSGSPIIIEAPATAKNGAFVRAIHRSEMSFNIRGCGPDSAALFVAFGVCSTFHLTTSVNEGGWYKGARPGYGLILDRQLGDPADFSAASFLVFPEPKIEATRRGASIRNAGGCEFRRGTIEGCIEFGLDLTAASSLCIVNGVDFEANGGFDIRDNGTSNAVLNAQTLAKAPDGTATSGFIVGNTAVGARIEGGAHNSVTVLAGAKGVRATMFDVGLDANGSMFIQPGAVVYRRGVFNRQTQAFLPDLAGDVSSVNASATGLSAPHILADWLKFPITLERFDCRGDFNGTTGYDNQSRLAGAVASGEKLVLSAGKRYLMDGPLNVAGMPVHIEGQHGSAALVFTANAKNGIVIAQPDYRNPVDLNGVALLTLGQEAGTGLSVAYSDADALLLPYFRRLRLQGIDVRGVDITKHGWKRGIGLRNGYWYDFTDIAVTGRVNANSSQKDSPSAMTFMDEALYAETGDYSIGGGYIRGLRLYYGKAGVRMIGAGTVGGTKTGTAIEGVNIQGVDIVGVNVGLDLQFGSASAGLVVDGGHINCFTKGIAARWANQALIDNLLIYKMPGATTETVAIELDLCDFAQSRSITCINQTSDFAAGGGWVGLRSTNSNFMSHNIKIERPSVGIDFGNGSNNVADCAVDGTLAGGNTILTSEPHFSSNTVRRSGFRRAATNAAAVTINNAVPTVVQSDTLNVLQGETYRVTASVSHTLGGTASDVLFDFFKASGTASVLFMSTATNVGQRQQQAANTAIGFFMSALMRVTASGTLVTGVRGYTGQSGATGSVGAGNAQFIIEAI
ncbi:hypothetical protein [Methylorubrum populi]